MIVLRIWEGILSIVEILGIFYILFMFSEKRGSGKWKAGLLLFLVTAVCVLLIYQRITSGLYSRYFMLTCIGISSVIAWLFFKMAFWKCFILTALYFETISLFDVLFVYIWTVAVKEIQFAENIQLQMSAERVVIMAFSRAILMGMVFWSVNCRAVVRRVFIKYKKIFAIFILLEYIVLLYCDQVFLFMGNRKIDIYFVFFPLLLLLVMAWTVSFIIYFDKKDEITAIHIRNDMMEKNYQDMVMLYQQRDIISHDIKNHLVILSSLMEEEEFNKARQYVKKIQEPIKALDQRRYTGNCIINSIMNDKAKKAKLFDISLNIKVVGNFMTAIEDIDWCSILANLLDNAIEACEKVTVEERRIDFSLVRKDEMIILDISNPYCGNVKLMDGKLYTLKEDKMLHGIGMESVKYSVEKNNGTLEYSFKDHIFRVNIVLFL